MNIHKIRRGWKAFRMDFILGAYDKLLIQGITIAIVGIVIVSMYLVSRQG